MARLRSPAIVASVAMNGGSLSRLIMKRVEQADRQAHQQRETDRQADEPARWRALPARAPAQPVRQELGADDRGERDDGAGGEVDSPGDDHHGRADGQHAEECDPMHQRVEAICLEERVVPVQDVNEGEHGQDARDQPPLGGPEDRGSRGRMNGGAIGSFAVISSGAAVVLVRPRR